MKRSISSTTTFTRLSVLASRSARMMSRWRISETGAALDVIAVNGSISAGCSDTTPSSVNSNAPSRTTAGFGLAFSNANKAAKNSSSKSSTRPSFNATNIFQLIRKNCMGMPFVKLVPM